jgi:hypothetical protein
MRGGGRRCAIPSSLCECSAAPIDRPSSLWTELCASDLVDGVADGSNVRHGSCEHLSELDDSKLRVCQTPLSIVVAYLRKAEGSMCIRGPGGAPSSSSNHIVSLNRFMKLKRQTARVSSMAWA